MRFPINIKRAFRQSLLVISGMVFGAYFAVGWPTMSGLTLGEVQEIQKTNTEIVKSIGRVAALFHDSSDLIMRYSHWIQGHKEETPFCPECVGDEVAMISKNAFDEINNAPSGITSRDIVRDASEINRGVQSLELSIINQHRALLFKLVQLRNKRSLKKPSTRPSRKRMGTVVTRL